MSQIVHNGVDVSAGWVPGEDLQANGYSFTCRYLSEDWRGLRDEEVVNYKATKTHLVIIGEYDTIDANGNQVSAMLGGGQAGESNATYADGIRKARQLPDASPIIFTLDVQPGSVDWGLVAAYLQAAAGTLGSKKRTGLYAGYDAIKWAFDNDLIEYGWQTYAWSGDQLDPRAMLFQYDIYGEFVSGINVDLNKAFAEDFGQVPLFDKPSPWTVSLHPDWFPGSLSIRYPTVGRWEWNGQILVLDTIRHNALVERRTWQYAGPSTGSGHAGKILEIGDKVNVERITDVKEVHEGKHVIRTWVLTGNGTWIPEDCLNLDFSIVRRKPRR